MSLKCLEVLEPTELRSDLQKQTSLEVKGLQSLVQFNTPGLGRKRTASFCFFTPTE